jgi:two-component system chemotaxis response regulator CheB
MQAVVVDDSTVMRTMLTEMLEDNGVDVVETASSGEEATGAVQRHEPDVVTMDVQLRDMDGVEAIERIMETTPTPIMVVSAHATEDATLTERALEAGAVAYMKKPGGEVSVGMRGLETEFVDHIEQAARSGVEEGTGSPAGGTTGAVSTAAETPSDRAFQAPVVVIGASTGGPQVLETVMQDVPLELNARILLVQHMMEGFTDQFADRIDAVTEYEVREAEDGDRVRPGQVLVAMGDYHMEVVTSTDAYTRVRLTQNAERHSVRPAIDPTMETAAQKVGDELVGVVLTGMGTDGAEGLHCIKNAGGLTIAQDEETSQVFGMPGSAIDTGCVDRVVPDVAVADAIAEGITEGTL